MLKKSDYAVGYNGALTKDIFKMTLIGDTSMIDAPGQFINIALGGYYLRRPLSVCDLNEGMITVIYRLAGKGTRYMSTLKEGEKLNVLSGLGNGFDTSKSGLRPLLIGGGVGAPPMYYLARTLLAEGKDPIVVLGFNTKDEAFYTEEFAALGANVLVATVDGSLGIRGLVTDAIDLADDYTYFFACGPEPMLKAVSDKTNTSGQLSFEERMGCGFGACMGCSCKTKYGDKRICRDGPVLEKEEVIW